jgi:hypothetical protein
MEIFARMTCAILMGRVGTLSEHVMMVIHALSMFAPLIRENVVPFHIHRVMTRVAFVPMTPTVRIQVPVSTRAVWVVTSSGVCSRFGDVMTTTAAHRMLVCRKVDACSQPFLTA